MHRTLTIVALFLTLAVLALPANALDTPRDLEEAPIFGTLGEAIRGLDFPESSILRLDPLAYQDGVALYRVVEVETGLSELALISVPVNPLTRVDVDRPDGVLSRRQGDSVQEAAPPAVTQITAGLTKTQNDSCRCIIRAYRDINRVNLLLVTNIDFNDLHSVSGQNDQYSSLETTCNPAFFFRDKNWGSSILLVPANTVINSLVPLGFNDIISSILHDLP